MKYLYKLFRIALAIIIVVSVFLAPIWNFIIPPAGNGIIGGDMQSYSLFAASRTIYYVNCDRNSDVMIKVMNGIKADADGCLRKEEFSGGVMIGFRTSTTYIDLSHDEKTRRDAEYLLTAYGNGKSPKDIKTLLIVSRDIRHYFWRLF